MPKRLKRNRKRRKGNLFKQWGVHAVRAKRPLEPQERRHREVERHVPMHREVVPLNVSHNVDRSGLVRDLMLLGTYNYHWLNSAPLPTLEGLLQKSTLQNTLRAEQIRHLTTFGGYSTSELWSLEPEALQNVYKTKFRAANPSLVSSLEPLEMERQKNLYTRRYIVEQYEHPNEDLVYEAPAEFLPAIAQEAIDERDYRRDVAQQHMTQEFKQTMKEDDREFKLRLEAVKHNQRQELQVAKAALKHGAPQGMKRSAAVYKGSIESGEEDSEDYYDSYEEVDYVEEEDSQDDGNYLVQDTPHYPAAEHSWDADEADYTVGHTLPFDYDNSAYEIALSDGDNEQEEDDEDESYDMNDGTYPGEFEAYIAGSGDLSMYW